MNAFEITCPQQFIREVARRAQVKRDKLDVVDAQVILAAAADLFAEMEQPKAIAMAAKMAKNSSRRTKRARGK